MKINTKTGLLDSAQYHLSPNCDNREQNVIDLLVIHNISLPPNQFGSDDIIDFFCNQLNVARHPYFETIKNLQVSSHVLIRRDGQIVQFVPFCRRAWHAGESSFQGKTRCNDFSIGIELEGNDNIAYENIQYQQLTSVTKAILAVYPAITHDRIVGHNHIAPNRKTDPGQSFDWDYFHSLIKSK